jgi:hypothetical protein
VYLEALKKKSSWFGTHLVHLGTSQITWLHDKRKLGRNLHAHYMFCESNNNMFECHTVVVFTLVLWFTTNI